MIKKIRLPIVKKSDPNKVDFTGIKYLEKPEMQVITYDHDRFHETDSLQSTDNLESLKKEDSVIWFNMHGIHDVELIRSVCDSAGFHRMIPRKIVDTSKDSRLLELDDKFYFRINSLVLNEKDELENERISFVLGENSLYSFQEKKGDHFDHVRDRIRLKLGRARYKSADFLLFLMLEAVIDNYSISLNDTDTDIDALQKTGFDNDNFKLIVEYESIKERLNLVKKSLLPIRDILKKLTNGGNRLIDRDNLKYFNGIKDWADQIYEEIEFDLQRVESGLNLVFSMQDHRMNQIMKTLTIVASIFIPLTFIAGIYGMNFENMPELKWQWGYYTVLISMGLIIIIMFAFFKIKKWF